MDSEKGNSIGESLIQSLRNKQPKKPIYLTDLVGDDLPKTKKRKFRQNWDVRKRVAIRVGELLTEGQRYHQKMAERINGCATLLNYGWVYSDGIGCFQFKNAHFCHVRTCPICQWRRSRMLLARFYDAFPRIYQENPKLRYILLTLTVKNCPVSELRDTIKAMNKAWDRLAKKKSFPAVGFIRSLEVTKELDRYDKKTKKSIKARSDYAHPHFHVLLALESSYFVGRNYLSTEKWSLLWQDALRVDYQPICDVRIVKRKDQQKNASEAILEGIRSAIVEVFKYTVKPSDMMQDSAFLCEMVNQMHKVRSVSFGGIFKRYLQDVETDAQEQDKVQPEEKIQLESENQGGFYFGWHNKDRRYRLES